MLPHPSGFSVLVNGPVYRSVCMCVLGHSSDTHTYIRLFYSSNSNLGVRVRDCLFFILHFILVLLFYYFILYVVLYLFYVQHNFFLMFDIQEKLS